MAEEKVNDAPKILDGENSEEQGTIEETRELLAKTYLMFLDQQKGGIIATGAGLGVNLNPLQKSTIKYLTNQESGDEKNDIFKTIGKNIKKKFMEKIAIQGSGPEGIHFEYDKAKLTKMKALIIANKDNEAELMKLMEQIQNGIDPTEGNPPISTPSDAPQTDQDQRVKPATDILPIYTKYENLKVSDDISAEEITYVEANAEKIVEDLETKGSLSDIEKIKDVDGNIVLECKGETPYIHSKAASDLIGLSLLYYKKTGKKLLLESAYRTMTHQAELKEENSAIGVPTADPGYSGHNLGYSIDVSKESRYNDKIGGVTGLQTIAKIFNFNPISSEDRHFDYSEFVEKYYDDKEARLLEAQKLDALFEDEKRI